MRMYLPRCERPVTPSALVLLRSARRGLAAATEHETSAGGRYVGAYLAASRAAAAVVAARGGVLARGRGSRSVWAGLEVEPILAQWAALFAAGAGKRAAAEACVARSIAARCE